MMYVVNERRISKSWKWMGKSITLNKQTSN